MAASLEESGVASQGPRRQLVRIFDDASQVPAVPMREEQKALYAKKVVVAYWDMRGLAQPIRLALELAGVEYVDVRLVAGGHSPSKTDVVANKKFWFSCKDNLGLCFPNLPYLIDFAGSDGSPDMVSLPQSDAILRYIQRQYLDPLGPAPSEASRKLQISFDVLLAEASDFDGSITTLGYNNWNDAGARRAFFGTYAPRQLRMFSEYLAESTSGYFCGDQVTVVDLKLYEAFDKVRIMQQESMLIGDALGDALFPANLLAFIAAIESVPRLRAYFDSVDCIKRPINNPHAQFQ